MGLMQKMITSKIVIDTVETSVKISCGNNKEDRNK
jgi:hypothetical protein